MKRNLSKPQGVSRLVLRYLLTDFRDRDFGVDALTDGYDGVNLAELKRTLLDQHRIPAVSFDVALNELEEKELITTGPMDVHYDPGEMVSVLGVFSKRLHACLTEKGYQVIGDYDFGFPDRVAVRTRADGKWHDNIKAQVQRDKILMLEGTLPIAEGDELQRRLPNGITEEYGIEHLEFQAAVMDFPAIMTAHVRKRGSALHERKHLVQQTNYNLTGANPRVNVNSIDNSANTITITNETVFSQLEKAIAEQVLDPKLSEELALAVQQMNQTRGTPEFTGRFQAFMALAANCMTVALPFLPELTKMLS